MTLTLTVYFHKAKRSSKSRPDKHKRSVNNCHCDENEVMKHYKEADINFSCDQKKFVDRKNTVIPGKIKEIIHSFKTILYIPR